MTIIISDLVSCSEMMNDGEEEKSRCSMQHFRSVCMGGYVPLSYYAINPGSWACPPYQPRCHLLLLLF
jgi:hypothetical protein